MIAVVESPESEGYGVLDTGATETVGSLTALERIVLGRRHVLGVKEEIKVVPAPLKSFKFGNGAIQKSESYLLLPQNLQNRRLSLGIYTLDAPGVPVLIGIKTLGKLQAIIDVFKGVIIMQVVDPAIAIPLVKSRCGHLLINLQEDWLTTGKRLELPRPSAPLGEVSRSPVRRAFQKLAPGPCPRAATSAVSFASSTETSDVLNWSKPVDGAYMVHLPGRGWDSMSVPESSGMASFLSKSLALDHRQECVFVIDDHSMPGCSAPRPR